jgi:hypothetical protein
MRVIRLFNVIKYKYLLGPTRPQSQLHAWQPSSQGWGQKSLQNMRNVSGAEYLRNGMVNLSL